MAVFAHITMGTVGGGQLELDVVNHASGILMGNATRSEPVDATQLMCYALGPSLGQCCGGEVHLRYERVGALDIAALRQCLVVGYVPVVLFGGSHAGKALITVLGTLPMYVTWVDSRDEIFPA